MSCGARLLTWRWVCLVGARLRCLWMHWDLKRQKGDLTAFYMLEARSYLAHSLSTFSLPCAHGGDGEQNQHPLDEQINSVSPTPSDHHRFFVFPVHLAHGV